MNRALQIRPPSRMTVPWLALLLPLTVALLGCQPPPQRAPCTLDEHCPANAYCHPEHRVCFLKSVVPGELTFTPASPSPDPHPRIEGQSQPGSQVRVYSDQGCTALVSETTADGEGHFSTALPLTLNQPNPFYVSSQFGSARESACTATLVYVHDDIPPRIVSVSPLSGGSVAELTSPIDVSFSEPIRVPVEASALTVLSGIDPVAGVLSSPSPTTVRFQPALPYAYARQYTVKASPSITDLAGNALTTQAGLGFESRGRKWSTPALLHPVADKIQYGMKLVPLTQGRALLVWYEGVAILDEYIKASGIWSARFTPGIGWHSVARLREIVTGEEFFDYQLLSDGADEAVLVIMSPLAGITATHHDASSGWHAPIPVAPVPTAGEHMAALRATMTSTGNVLIAWQKNEALYAASRTRANGWSPVKALGSASATASPEVALGPEEIGQMLWNDFSGLRGTRYDLSTGWGSTSLLDTTSGIRALSATTTGRFVVIGSNPDRGVWGMAQEGGSWSPYQQLLPPAESGSVTAFRLIAEPGGDVLATWTSQIGSDTAVLASEFHSASGWSAPVIVAPLDGIRDLRALHPLADGSILATWSNYPPFSGTRTLWQSTYRSGSGWSEPSLVTPDFFPFAFAINPEGDGFAASFDVDDGINNQVMVSEYR